MHFNPKLFKVLIIQTKLFGPLDFELSRCHCTCNRVTVLALCTISDGRLSRYQVSFDSLLYFQRYAQDKFNIAKIRKGNNSINTDDRVMALAFCIFL